MKIEYKKDNGRRVIREIEPISISYCEENNDKNWSLKVYDILDNEEKEFAFENIQRMYKRNKKQRVSCVTTYILNDSNEFLLIHHNKLNKWVPPGGKIDNEDTPDEAAIRETFEETGLRITLMPGNDSPSNITPPFGVQLNPIIPGEVEHVDYIYLARSNSSEVDIDINEAKKFGWFSLEKVNELDTFDEVKKWCEYFSQIINKR